MQVYQGVVVTKENEAGVPVGSIGAVVGVNDPVDVKFEDPNGMKPTQIVQIQADSLRVL